MNTWLQALLRSTRHARTHPAVRTGQLALVLAAVVLSGAAFHAWQVAGKLAAAQSRLNEQRRVAVQGERTRALLIAYRSSLLRLAELPQRHSPSPAAVPSQAQMVQAVSRLAERSGLKLLNETYDPLAERGVSGWRISLAAQADYPATRAFLNGLAALPMPVQTERVRIDTMRDPEAGLRLQMLLRAQRVVGASPLPGPTR